MSRKPRTPGRTACTDGGNREELKYRHSAARTVHFGVDLNQTSLAPAVRTDLSGFGRVLLTAYRRTKTRYMRDASIGFGIITLGVFIEGVLFRFLGLDLVSVHIIESVAVALGFIVLLISLRR